MSGALQSWLKPGLILSVLALLTWLAPASPLDPWNLLSPQKIATMILALAVIQAFGAGMVQYLGARTGSLVTGFFGGLISSTATIASLAKKSKAATISGSGEMLTFLSATGAMLIEGLALVATGTTDLRLSNLVIFIGPLLATAWMIVIEFRAHDDRRSSSTQSTFQILPVLKLALLIVVILSASQIFQRIFGQNGLLVLTSLVSLFEIHGSVIANVQMHEAGLVSAQFLCSLLAVSIVASYLSKIFLITTLGSARLRSQALWRTFYLFCSLGISWLAAMSLG
ncbi:MAG: DUF4010 domain-containing protein [Bdellovibrionaceae bacterium]|nr:DUF4010 domain-containing protein [Pseudobdellovibrionaceae bacterium]